MQVICYRSVQERAVGYSELPIGSALCPNLSSNQWQISTARRPTRKATKAWDRR